AAAVGLDMAGEGLAQLGDLLGGEDAAQVHGAALLVGGGELGAIDVGVEDRETGGPGGVDRVGGGVLDGGHAVILGSCHQPRPGDRTARTWRILLRRGRLRRPMCRRRSLAGRCWASSTRMRDTGCAARRAPPTGCCCTRWPGPGSCAGPTAPRCRSAPDRRRCSPRARCTTTARTPPPGAGACCTEIGRASRRERV